jgi:hypothetical protein
MLVSLAKLLNSSTNGEECAITVLRRSIITLNTGLNELQSNIFPQAIVTAALPHAIECSNVLFSNLIGIAPILASGQSFGKFVPNSLEDWRLFIGIGRIEQIFLNTKPGGNQIEKYMVHCTPVGQQPIKHLQITILPELRGELMKAAQLSRDLDICIVKKKSNTHHLESET